MERSQTAVRQTAHHRVDDADKTFPYRHPEVHALVDAALADLSAADSRDPALPMVAHLLAFYLYQQRRYDESAEQFRAVDGWVGALPWRYFEQPRPYLVHRNTAVARAARKGSWNLQCHAAGP